MIFMVKCVILFGFIKMVYELERSGDCVLVKCWL